MKLGDKNVLNCIFFVLCVQLRVKAQFQFPWSCWVSTKDLQLLHRDPAQARCVFISRCLHGLILFHIETSKSELFHQINEIGAGQSIQYLIIWLK